MHRIEVHKDLATDMFQAFCDCGWVAWTVSPTRTAAHEVGDEHVTTMSRLEND